MKIDSIKINSFRVHNYINSSISPNKANQTYGATGLSSYYFPLAFGKKLIAEPISNQDFKAMELVYNLDDKEFHEIVSYPDAVAFMKYNQENELTTYLVKDADRLLGYYQLRKPQDGNLYIETINLNPEYRGKHTGFTTFMFKNITDIARESGADKLSLHVAGKNSHAQNLYKRSGFKVIKVQKAAFNNDDDALYMEKVL